MMKVFCTTVEFLPENLQAEEIAFTFFKSAKRAGIGTIARGWRGHLKRRGFSPTPQAWDFTQFCLAVCAADLACIRSSSADGWTRVIELTVGLCEPLLWQPFQKQLADLLKVLTGDHWTLRFVDGGATPPEGKSTPSPLQHDCVSLLSGGLDSLIGGIDLVAQGRRPMFVSQLAHEDSLRQRTYATRLGGANSHWQWSHGISFRGQRETSTRARSLAFYGFAVLAASRITQNSVQIFVPENGFICINPPLVPGRVSSLSTRTTHPLFISRLQSVLDEIGVQVRFELPYKFKTKGQMLQDCLNQELLQEFAADSTSCGRFRTYNRKHCGRCVPCMIRKGAFLAWNPEFDKTEYKYRSLAEAEKASGPDDPMAAALAVLTVEEKGLDKFLGTSLAFATPQERSAYREVIARGIGELATLLRRDCVL